MLIDVLDVFYSYQVVELRYSVRSDWQTIDIMETQM